MTRRFCALGWVVAVLAVISVGAQLFHTGPLSGLPFDRVVQGEFMGGTGPGGTAPHLW
jgi:hypothetical protein